MKYIHTSGIMCMFPVFIACTRICHTICMHLICSLWHAKRRQWGQKAAKKGAEQIKMKEETDGFSDKPIIRIHFYSNKGKAKISEKNPIRIRNNRKK